MVVLKDKSSYFVEKGNRLVFTDSIKSSSGRLEMGEIVIVRDRNQKVVGWGIFNPKSVYRVRILQSIAECRSDPESILDLSKIFESRVRTAINLRHAIGLPSDSTTVYRLINSDGDGLSGVIIDVLDQIAVVHSGVSWLEIHREMVVSTLRSLLNIDTVVWRLRSVVTHQEGFPDAEERVFSSDPSLTMDSEIEVVENGIRYKVSLSGQKTGFYSDQRDNRQFVKSFSENKTVLDLCCYTGGFSLNAAQGGASEVLGIDSSQSAISLARHNAEINHLHHSCTFECADIEKKLQEIKSNRQKFDIVVLDPPKFATSQSHMKSALHRYRRLNREAIQAVTPHGLFVTCSCSGTVSEEAFIKTVKDAADLTGRRLKLLKKSNAAADHLTDLNHPEGIYLKCLAFSVD